MSEFWSSFTKWFNEKASSPLYWTYFVFFVAWNWKFFQIIFLEDSALFYEPRVRYIENLVLNLHLNEHVNSILNIGWRIIPPALFTFITIKFLPLVHRWAFKIYTDNLFDRKLYFQKQRVQFEEELAKLSKKEVSAKRAQTEQKKILEEVKTQEEKWEEELAQEKRRDMFMGFQRLVGLIYRNGGLIHPYDLGELIDSSRIVAFAGTHGLISTERSGGETTIKLTEKGKYFSRKLGDQGMIAN